jgi:hypothetical protein
MNIFTLMHYDAFLRLPPPFFHQGFANSLDLLLSLAGLTLKTQMLARNMFISFLKKLESNKSQFPASFFLEAVPWRNLFPLISMVRKFVFSSAHWTSPTAFAALGSPDAPSAASSSGKKLANGSAAEVYVLDASVSQSSSDASRKKKAAATVYRFLEFQTLGVHWTETGTLAADTALCERLASLLRALRFHSFDPESNPGLSPGEKEFLTAAKDEYFLFNAAGIFIQLLLNLKSDDDRDRDKSERAIAKKITAFIEAKSDAERKQIIESIAQNRTAKKMITIKGKKEHSPALASIFQPPPGLPSASLGSGQYPNVR